MKKLMLIALALICLTAAACTGTQTTVQSITADTTTTVETTVTQSTTTEVTTTIVITEATTTEKAFSFFEDESKDLLTYMGSDATETAQALGSIRRSAGSDGTEMIQLQDGKVVLYTGFGNGIINTAEIRTESEYYLGKIHFGMALDDIGSAAAEMGMTLAEDTGMALRYTDDNGNTLVVRYEDSQITQMSYFTDEN